MGDVTPTIHEIAVLVWNRLQLESDKDVRRNLEIAYNRLRVAAEWMELKRVGIADYIP